MNQTPTLEYESVNRTPARITLGLIAIGFSMSGMFRSKKERILSALAALVTLGAFAWWSMPVLFG